MNSREIWTLIMFSVLFLAAGCDQSDKIITMTSQPTHMSQSTGSKQPTATLNFGIKQSMPVCPPARGEGTVSPAVSIYSITFVVNGHEQVVSADDTLKVLPGDEIKVIEITVCTEVFSGDSGEICVDLAPVGPSGQEIISEHSGTHMVRIVPGFMSISGPDHTWTVSENWGSIAAVLNHWPPKDTEDIDCGNRRCEHDDRIVLYFR